MASLVRGHRRPSSRAPWRKYLAAFRISLAAQLAYPAEIVMRLLFLVVIMFIFASLWHTTFAEMNATRLGGLTVTQMLWYLAITEALILSRPRTTLRLDEEVRTGAFAYAVARPYHFVLFRYAEASGERVLRLALNIVAGAALAALFTGGSGLSGAGLAPGLVLAILAVTVDFLLTFCVQMLAFWVEDTTPFVFVYERLLMIMGGMLLPLTLFPGPLEPVARLLPFASIIGEPAATLVAFDAGRWLQSLALLAVWLVLAGSGAAVLFRHGLRVVSANGG